MNDSIKELNEDKAKALDFLETRYATLSVYLRLMESQAILEGVLIAMADYNNEGKLSEQNKIMQTLEVIEKVVE